MIVFIQSNKTKLFKKEKFYFLWKFRWYKLSNKEGKFDKERGEIEVSLQFYAKNDTTGSVLDLTTKKKHLSVKDIKHFGDKVKEAIKHKIPGGDDQV